VRRNVRKSVKRGGAHKYKVRNPDNVPIDTIDRCLSKLNLTGPDDFATGDSPGVSPTIRRGGRWGGGFMDIFKTPERVNRGNKKEGVEGALLQIYKLKEKARKANKQIIDIIEIKRVLPDIPKVNNFINCLTTSQEGAGVQ